MDLTTISTAIAAAAGSFAAKSADSAAASAGKQLVDWLHAKLTAPADASTLQSFEKNPGSPGLQRSMEGILMRHAEEDPSIEETLRQLVRKVRANNSATLISTGDGNTSTIIQNSHVGGNVGRNQ